MHACSRRLTRFYKSLPLSKRFTTSSKQLSIMHDSTAAPLEKLTFSFNEKMTLRTFSGSSSSSYKTASDCSRGSDNSVFHTPPAPKSFMDSSGHSEDLHFLSSSREADRTSLSSTTSSTGYSRRPDSGTPFYLPMNNVKGGRSPGSNNKVSVSCIILHSTLIKFDANFTFSQLHLKNRLVEIFLVHLPTYIPCLCPLMVLAITRTSTCF